MTFYDAPGNTPSSEIRFQPDRPISATKDDRLGRTPFVRNLASQFLEYDDPSSLIIALCGPWGSGKSSLLNLLSAELESSDKAIVVRFNPWNFTDIDQLITMYFRDFGGAVGKSSSDVRRDIGRKLSGLGALLSVGKYLPGVGPLIEAGSDAARGLGEAIGAVGDQTVEEIKNELDDLLEGLNTRVFVFIDDLDRLDAQSLRLMFRLIRLNADFKNTTYVLAFDRSIVETALSAEQGGYGQGYLEKIVQVTFDIPPPNSAKLSELTLESLDPVVGPIPDDEWDRDRWQEAYLQGLRHLIQTPRDVIRFVNGLKLNFGFVAGEVDPVDFICLEAIRTFEPRLYDFVRNNMNLFVGSQGGTVTILGPKPDDIKQQVEAALERCDPSNRDPIRELLQRMFPEAPLGSTYFAMSGFRDGWLRAKRICTTDYFDKCFYLQVPEDEVSLGEYQSLISRLSKREEWTERLLIVIQNGRVRSLLNHFAMRADLIPKVRIETILVSIFDVADEIAFELTTRVSIDDQRFVAYATEALLQSLSEPSDRVAAIHRVIEEAEGLSSVVYVLDYLEPKSREAGVISPEDFEVLKQAILVRIRGAAKRDKLAAIPQLAIVLFRWRDWAGIEEPRDFVGRLIQTDDGLLDFLAGMMTQVRSTGRPSIYYNINEDQIRQFVESSETRRRVEKIKDARYDSLSCRHRVAVDAYLNPS